MNKNRGFTIVEMLIVIVIIGILAALVLNTVRGIQKQARNTQRISTAEAYKTIINSYIAANGKLPHSGSACLGRLKTTNKCWGVETTTNVTYPHPDLDAALMTISPTLPEVEQTPVTSDGYIKKYIGPGYAINTNRYVDGVQVRLAIDYWLEGSEQDCGMTALKEIGTNTFTAFNDKPYTRSENLMTFCATPVYAPADL